MGGSTEYNKPSKPEVVTSPYNQPAFNMGPAYKQAEESVAAGQGQQMANAGARASKFGTGNSSGTAGSMASLAAQNQNQLNAFKQQGAQESFKQQLAQQQFADTAANQRYKDELGLYEAEKARKRAKFGMFGSFID